MNFSGNIIWSADLSSGALLRLLQSGDLPKTLALKLDRLFFEDANKDWIATVQDEFGFPVFADAKIIEVPDKSLAIAQKYLRYRPWMLNIMAGALSTLAAESPDLQEIDALKRFADACHSVGTLPCAVTVLTSKTNVAVLQEFNRSAEGEALFYVEQLISFGFTDIVCSPLEATAIRRAYPLAAISLNTPGVRLPDSPADDQSRIMTPRKALESGATRLVIGRDLSRNAAYVENYAAILSNIEGGNQPCLA